MTQGEFSHLDNYNGFDFNKKTTDIYVKGLNSIGGNSGGPIVNHNGEVARILSWGESISAGSVYNKGSGTISESIEYLADFYHECGIKNGYLETWSDSNIGSTDLPVVRPKEYNNLQIVNANSRNLPLVKTMLRAIKINTYDN